MQCCLLSLRFSLTADGLALAERLESAEDGTKDGPEGDVERVRTEEDKEEGGPGVVDLTLSDDDEKDRVQ